MLAFHSVFYCQLRLLVLGFDMRGSGVTIFPCFSFFFQAEDGIRDSSVTGVQTCALPISLYGFVRDVFTDDIAAPPLRPVMSLHSRIMLLKKVGKGEKLGYGCTFETARDSLIATIPIGYDDGYRRALSNRGPVIVRGSFAPVVGRVSMDLTLVDLPDVPSVKLNDRVTLIGMAGDFPITAEEIAETIGTISYEVTCGLSERVPRLYVNSTIDK